MNTLSPNQIKSNCVNLQTEAVKCSKHV